MIPPSVLEEAAEGLKEYKNIGMSLAEISHRAPAFLEIIEEEATLVKQLYGLSDEFEVIWGPEGASSQLASAPMNLLSPRQSMAIVDICKFKRKLLK